jgi:hypothetical protein
MGAGVAADAVMLVHFAFILFVIFGAIATLKWASVAWLHLPCLAWAIWIALSGSICPLTPLENDLRVLAGERGYSGGFIDHYITRLVYPEDLTRRQQVALGLILIGINVTAYGIVLRRKRCKSLIPEKVA